MKRSNDALLKRLRKQPPVSDVCMSVISNAELSYGIDISPRWQQDQSLLESFLHCMEFLDPPEEAASHYAKIRADLKVRGNIIGANALLVAAHARSLS